MTKTAVEDGSLIIGTDFPEEMSLEDESEQL